MRHIIILIYLSFFVFLNTSAFHGSGGGMVFIENSGQYDNNVLFFIEGQNKVIFITKTGITIDACEENSEELKHPFNTSIQSGKQNCHVSRIRFSSNPSSVIVRKGLKLQHHINYIQSDGKSYTSNVFTEVTLRNVAEGIDLSLSVKDQALKYDLIVSERGDLGNYSVVYEGFERLDLADNGLHLKTSIETFSEEIPLAYRETESGKTEVTACYSLSGNRVSYNVDGYNKGQKLLIDPILIFSTFSGSTADNWGSTATYDSRGNLYSAGIASHYLGGTFPVVTGSYQKDYGGNWDVAISKYDSAGGILLYSTYFGGTNSEMAQSLVVNENDELLVLGITSSSNFPTTQQAYDRTFNGGISTEIIGISLPLGTDIFVARFSENGKQLLGSTFLGGSRNDGIIETSSNLVKNYGDESRGDIYVDNDGTILIASKTYSANFPVAGGLRNVRNGESDAVIARFDAGLTTLLSSTYIGGNSDDAAYSIKTNSSGEVVVAGVTQSISMDVGFQDTPLGSTDGWVAIIQPNLSEIINGRVLTTPANDLAYFVDVDFADFIYVLGVTNGNYPEVGNGFTSGSGQFVHKFSKDLENTMFSTNFGNFTVGPDISPTAFLVNDCGNIYISGWGGAVNNNSGSVSQYFTTGTQGLPVTLNALMPASTNNDFYLAVFEDNMSSLVYATFLGGGNNATHVDGGTSRFDKRGIVYHAVCAGCRVLTGTANSDFPTTPGAWSRTNNSQNCNNAAFKFDLTSLDARIVTFSEDRKIQDIRKVCIPDKIIFTNQSIGGVTFEWDFGDGRKISTTSRADILHEYLLPGVYTVTLRIIDLSTCAEEDVTSLVIRVFKEDFTASEDAEICEGDIINLQATGGVGYQWKTESGEVLSTQPFWAYQPTETQDVILTTTGNNCNFSDTVHIDVINRPESSFKLERLCDGKRTINVKVEVSGATEFYVDMGDGNQIDNKTEFSYNYVNLDNYTVTLYVYNEECVYTQSQEISISELIVPSVFTPGNGDNKNDSFKIFGFQDPSLDIYNRWGNSVFTSKKYQNDWKAEKTSPGTYYYLVKDRLGNECKGWVQIMK